MPYYDLSVFSMPYYVAMCFISIRYWEVMPPLCGGNLTWIYAGYFLFFNSGVSSLQTLDSSESSQMWTFKF
jgi:hypothetical protein